MSELIKPPSSSVSHCIYVIDSIVCKKIHNPVIAATIVGGILVSVAVKSYFTWSPYNSFEECGFLPDFLQNVMNLLFIMRFPSKSKKSLRIHSNKYIETVLFAGLNIVAMVSLLSPYPFSSLMGQAFRVLLWVSIICPYVILVLNLVELAWGHLDTQPEKEKIPEAKKDNLLGLIVDANNSFMAIFIAQSFTAVNLDLPFYENSFIPVIYKYAAYSLKFYLIYCFVLYEIVVVIYDMHDIKNYTELYEPVQLGTKKKSWGDFLDNLTPYCLLGTTLLAMVFDGVMMWLGYQHM
ncbi:hypothetical protein JCM33374_g4153 [Metschnikowia sp. JCM 33374]|nr:hypothetical protein JCM33374_g4153 [Metschnikowia sp. JCM 33374]